MKKYFFPFLIAMMVVAIFSCSKEAGEGGNSTIYGKMTTYNYNAEFTNLRGIYPSADEDVYIIYGNDRSYSERVRTNYEGVYEFKYLRPGDYTIYAYSKDSTLTIVSEMVAVIRNVTITGNKETLEVEEMKIFR
jgi:hypothetical protein